MSQPATPRNQFLERAREILGSEAQAEALAVAADEYAAAFAEQVCRTPPQQRVPRPRKATP